MWFSRVVYSLVNQSIHPICRVSDWFRDGHVTKGDPLRSSPRTFAAALRKEIPENIHYEHTLGYIYLSGIFRLQVILRMRTIIERKVIITATTKEPLSCAKCLT